MRTVYRTSDFGEACRVRELLAERGITAEIAQEVRSSPGIFPLDLSILSCVWIADEARAEEARTLIQEL